MATQRLQELRDELEEVQNALRALRANGQEHTLNGSHAFKGVSYADLRKQESQLRETIMVLNGAKHFTLPDFS